MSTSAYEYCPGCEDVLEDGAPCECVFFNRGAIDAHGVLHTPVRSVITWESEELVIEEENGEDSAYWDTRIRAELDAEAGWFRFGVMHAR